MIQTNQNKKRPVLIPISAISIIAFAVLNIVLAYISLKNPGDSSEFGALRNFALGLYDLLIIVFSLLSVLSAIYMLKLKRWAFITSVIYSVLLMLFLAASDLKEIIFELSPGAALSLNHEILPAVILILLILSFKSFRNNA